MIDWRDMKKSLECWRKPWPCVNLGNGTRHVGMQVVLYNLWGECELLVLQKSKERSDSERENAPYSHPMPVQMVGQRILLLTIAL